MSSLFALGPIALFALAIIAIVVGLLVVVVRPLRRLAMTEGALKSAKSAEVRARVRSGTAILVGTVVAIGGFAIGLSPEQPGSGRLVAVTPLLAIAAAILVFAIAPTPEFLEPRAVRSAELVRRRPRDFVAARTLVLPILAAFALTAVLAVFLVVADSGGQSISQTTNTGVFDGATISSTSGPYPGLYYAAPIVVAALFLGILAAVAIARIAAAPRPTDESLRAADDATRTLSIRAVSLAATSAFTATLSSVLYMASSATANVGAHYSFSINSTPVESGSDQVLMAISTVELVGAGVAVLASIALMALAIGQAVRRPFAVSTDLIAQTA